MTPPGGIARATSSGNIVRMKHCLTLLTVLAALSIAAPNAFAQGPYVGASIGADIARFSGVDDGGNTGSGEALSWSLRIGTPLAERFGVELQFVRPQEITHEDGPQSLPLTGALGSVGFAALATPAGTQLTPLVPTINISVSTAQRHTSLGTTAWVRQQITPRVAMVYLGGIAFSRVTRRFSYDITVPPILAGLP